VNIHCVCAPEIAAERGKSAGYREASRGALRSAI
jgi:hypothetical protein